MKKHHILEGISHSSFVFFQIKIVVFVASLLAPLHGLSRGSLGPLARKELPDAASSRGGRSAGRQAGVHPSTHLPCILGLVS